MLQSDYAIFKNYLYNNFPLLDNWDIIYNRVEDVRNEAAQRQRNSMESDNRRGSEPVLDSNTEKDRTATTGILDIQHVSPGHDQANDAPDGGIRHQDGKPRIDGAGLTTVDESGKPGRTDDMGSREHSGRIPVVSESATDNVVVQGREDTNTTTDPTGTTNTSGVVAEPVLVGLHSKLDKLVDIPDDNLQVDYVPH